MWGCFAGELRTKLTWLSTKLTWLSTKLTGPGIKGPPHQGGGGVPHQYPWLQFKSLDLLFCLGRDFHADLAFTRVLVFCFVFFSEKHPGWDTPIYSQYSECQSGETDCSSYVPDDLCTHLTADHNYYMICRNLLSAQGGDPLHPEGLLHDIPSDIDSKYQLQMLVRECTKPFLPDQRLRVKDQLFKALEEIRKDYL